MGIPAGSGCVLLVVACALFAGCSDPESRVCASGRLCPPDSRCDDVRDRCVTEDQALACVGRGEEDACEFGGASGRCLGGYCEVFVCGDGLVTAPEDCEPGDIGEATCRDYGFHVATGLGCDPTTCKYETSGCREYCGDTTVNGDEVCDGSPPTDLSCVDEGYDLGNLECAESCTADTARCGIMGWTAQNVGTTERLYSVWAAADDAVFVLGENGTYFFDGTSWSTMAGGPKACDGPNEIWGRSATQVFAATCLGVFMYDGAAWTHEVTDLVMHGIGPVGPTDVYAVGIPGSVLRFDGASWSSAPSTAAIDALDIVGTSATDLWAMDYGRIEHFDGTSWREVIPTGGLPQGFFTSIDMVDGQLLLGFAAPVDDGLVFRFDGSTWTRTSVPSVDALSASSSQRIVVATVGGAVRHYDGAMWQEGLTPGGAQLRDIYASPGGASYAVGNNGTVLRFDAAYSVSRTPPNWIVMDVWQVPGTDELYAAGCVLEAMSSNAWPSIFHFDGDSWSITHEQLTLGDCYGGVWGTGADNVYVTNPGADESLRWDGATWTGTSLSYTGDLWGWGPGNILTVGAPSYRFDGTDWTEEDFGTAEPYAVWGASPGDVHVVGLGGEILHYDGAAWTPMTSPTTEDLVFVWGTGLGDVYATTATGTLLRYDGSAWTIILSDPAIRIRAVSGTGPDDLFAAADEGIILHFDGARWSHIRSGTTSDFHTIHATSRRIVALGDSGALTEIHRDRFWHCAAETACADGIDNDCDGLVDDADADCP